MYRNRYIHVTSTLLIALLLPILVTVTACDEGGKSGKNAGLDSRPYWCDLDNGGLTLPEGFCAGIVADNLGFVRHLAVDREGRILVTLRNQRLDLGGLLMLTDPDRDGYMDEIRRINHEPGMGIAIHNEHLYFASDVAVMRYRLDQLSGAGAPEPEMVVSRFPVQERHGGKALAFDGEGNLYVNVGAPGNACQQEEGQPGSPGEDPCAQLARGGGIWRFESGGVGLTFDEGIRYASGIRNAYALDWHHTTGRLYLVQHGRDDLVELWPQYYTAREGADLPAEELLAVNPGSEYGWPYCYYDPVKGARILAPEYGGDGVRRGRCRDYPEPVAAFPAHYGPNDMLFYRHNSFPVSYRDGAFIAFHGSYNRGPYQEAGYQIVFVPFAEGAFSRQWRVFADGFAGRDQVNSAEEAEHRPTGLAVGQDGSLYVSDSVQGRIWRIGYFSVDG